ncbi:MAG: hypothetical protein JSR56_14530, partial [Proteobacteria bacterium]|nr:hypothetical protein [Pseudomonadota bacterium]
MPAKPGLFAELKRRNVLRAAVLYIAAVWALAQGISQLSPSFDLPEYVTRWFVIACAIAFPFWLAFAWLYEITPHGIKRESEVAAGESITHSTARRLDFAIISVLAVAVALLAWQLLVARRAEAPTRAAAAAAKPASAAHATAAPSVANTSLSAVPAALIPAQSIAVLPFENLNVDKKDAYFVAGVQDLILTKLADVGSLKVIS